MNSMDLFLRIKLMFGSIFYLIVVLAVLFSAIAIFSVLRIQDFIKEEFSEMTFSYLNIISLLMGISLFLNQDYDKGSGVVNRFF